MWPRFGRPGAASNPTRSHAAVSAILGGADGITVHLREDRRHIQDRDVRLLRQTVAHQRLNLEMAAVDAIVAIACEVKPDEATLVPERREELTTEGGLDVVAHAKAVEARPRTPAGGRHRRLAVHRSRSPPDRDGKASGGPRHRDPDRLATPRQPTPPSASVSLTALEESTHFARELGLHVHMGHGLNYVNVQAVCRIPGVEELNIGHSIVSRAVLVGMERAVREMKRVMASSE